MLFNKKIASARDILVNGKFSCQYLVPNLQENVGIDIFVNGVYEEDTIQFLQKNIPGNGVYLDLGANIGSILVPLSKTRPDIKILAVEAAPRIYKYLEYNVSLNKLNNVCLINNALFDKDDEVLDFFSPEDKYGKGSFSPIFNDHAVKVVTKRVDTLLKMHNFSKVDTIKIDVEGFEYFVFKGAIELLGSESAPDIVFEFVDWAEGQAMGLVPGDAQRLLLTMGYQLYSLKKTQPVKINSVVEKGALNLFASKKIQ